MASTYLSRTQGSGNRQIFTQSFWCKIADPSGTQTLAGTFDDSNNYNYCYLDGGNLKLQWKASGSVTATLDTNRKLRDTNAFYNIVYAVDTTQSTASDRIKLYINGVQETSFSTATYPTLNRYTEVNANNITHRIGSIDGSQQYFNGIMSYVAHIDGTQELPTIFGETDATTGEWKIKTAITPSVGWGTNGFLILKDGNSLTDQSSNSNNFTLGGGTLTNTEDCPDNVFATMNPLDNYYPNYTFANGNTTVTTGGNYSYPQATIYVNTGKWYWECKVISKTGGGDEYMIGIQGKSVTGTNSPAQSNNGYTIYATDGQVYGWGATASYGSAYTAGDIIGVALDCTNNKIYWSKNGSWMGSGNPSTGSNGYSINAANTTAQGGYSPVAGFYDSPNAVFSFNFGNGFFGTTAISSEGTNASGIGKFEYDVPSGYTALSTKGLNL